MRRKGQLFFFAPIATSLFNFNLNTITRAVRATYHCRDQDWYDKRNTSLKWEAAKFSGRLILGAALILGYIYFPFIAAPVLIPIGKAVVPFCWLAIADVAATLLSGALAIFSFIRKNYRRWRVGARVAPAPEVELPVSSFPPVTTVIRAWNSITNSPLSPRLEDPFIDDDEETMRLLARADSIIAHAEEAEQREIQRLIDEADALAAAYYQEQGPGDHPSFGA